MEEMSLLGNIELLNSIITLDYLTFGYSEEMNRSIQRIYEPCNISREYLAKILCLPINSFEFNEKELNHTAEERIKKVYELFIDEAIKRGLVVKDNTKRSDMIYTNEFNEWMIKMKNSPTYIREIYSTNFLGNRDIYYADDEIIGFDYPVRKACKILNEKGYNTYWSSANRDDYERRESQVIDNKSVAYILIDFKNLNEELKEKLRLDGECDFWGLAEEYSDNGTYYGIWSEITSLDMKCEDLSNQLVQKALSLPNLTNQYDNKKRY